MQATESGSRWFMLGPGCGGTETPAAAPEGPSHQVQGAHFSCQEVTPGRCRPLPASAPAPQQRENLRELMFILVTPMSLSGVERLKEEARGDSQKRSDSSSRSSSS